MRIKIILAGGNGQRLYPLSTNDNPKQYLSFYDEKECLLDKILSMNINHDKTLIVTSINDKDRLERLRDRNTDIIYEPYRRDTSAAILYGCLYLQKLYGKECPEIVIMPSDNILNPEFLTNCIESMSKYIKTFIVTFGVVPTYPSTVYGYIRRDLSIDEDIYTVHHFKEKPSLQMAESYVRTGDYFWNSGIYYSSLDYFIQLFKTFSINYDNISFYTNTGNDEYFEKLVKIPFDVDISEKCKSLLVFKYNSSWIDVGNWKAVYDCCPSHLLDKDSNYIQSKDHRKVLFSNVRNSLIVNTTEKRIILNEFDGLVLILTDSDLLISDIDQCHRIKEVIDNTSTNIGLIPQYCENVRVMNDLGLECKIISKDILVCGDKNVIIVTKIGQ